MGNNDHWASDVFLGSAIGFFTAKAIVALHKKDIDLVVMPVIEDQFRGLALFYQFWSFLRKSPLRITKEEKNAKNLHVIGAKVLADKYIVGRRLFR